MMELDELKTAWMALNNRLERSETLEARIIREMKQTKANRSLNILVGYEIFGLLVLILALPAIAFVWGNFQHLLSAQILKVYLIVFTLIGIVWFCCKLYGLMKINFSNQISDNIYRINNYNIQIKKEKIWGTIASIPIMVLAIIIYAQLKVPMNLWVFLSCIFFVVIIITVWSYKKLYDNNIQSIMKSLEELRELKEE